MKSLRLTTVMVAGIAAMMPSFAQAQAPAQAAATVTVPVVTVPAVTDSTTPVDTLKSFLTKKKVSPFFNSAPRIEIQNIRPSDMRGLNVYESPKDAGLSLIHI